MSISPHIDFFGRQSIPFVFATTTTTCLRKTFLQAKNPLFVVYVGIDESCKVSIFTNIYGLKRKHLFQ